MTESYAIPAFEFEQEKFFSHKMSVVEVVRKRSSLDFGKRKTGKLMYIVKNSYKLLILVPVIFTVVFIHTYQPFSENSGIYFIFHSFKI